jgi:hypothetical protein
VQVDLTKAAESSTEEKKISRQILRILRRKFGHSQVEDLIETLTKTSLFATQAGEN